jgi:predicted nucleic acid-binding protein
LLEVHSSWSLNLLALEIACRTRRTAYDSLYIALAVREQAELATADRRLYNSLQGGGFAAVICWVEDIP